MDAQGEPREQRIAAIAALADPARLALYELVGRSTEPLSRDAAAAATGLPRSTVAFHLDKLAEEGMLEVHYRRLSGRSGPGAGRPSKLYGRVEGEVSVSVPERRYDLLGDLLATAIEESAGDVRATAQEVALREGRVLGTGCDSLLGALERNGFEPIQDGSDVVFANCPFHSLAQRHTELVCRLNHALVEGMDAATPGDAATIVTEPGAGRCCIRITGAGAPASPAG